MSWIWRLTLLLGFWTTIDLQTLYIILGLKIFFYQYRWHHYRNNQLSLPHPYNISYILHHNHSFNYVYPITGKKVKVEERKLKSWYIHSTNKLLTLDKTQAVKVNIICSIVTVKETYTLGGDEVLLYSKYSEYIHETKTGIIPNKKDTWRQKANPIRKLTSQKLA